MDPVVDRHTALVGIRHSVGTWAVDMDCTLVDILPYAEVAFHKVERLRSLLVEDKGVHCRLLLEEDRQVGSTPREHGLPSVDILALLMDALPNTTTMIDLTLRRNVTKNVFRLAKMVGDKTANNFRKTKPGTDLAD